MVSSLYMLRILFALHFLPDPFSRGFRERKLISRNSDFFTMHFDHFADDRQLFLISGTQLTAQQMQADTHPVQQWQASVHRLGQFFSHDLTGWC